METDPQATDAFIGPLTPKWRTAVERFLQRSAPIPPEHPELTLLGTACEQLQDGSMVDDRLIHAYMRLLGQVPLSVPAIYMDSINEIQITTSNDGMPTFRELKAADIQNMQHIFWPIHHHDKSHWSLVHIDQVSKIITGHDSFIALGEKRTFTAALSIYGFWMRSFVTDTAERNTWTIGTSPWRFFSQVQATSSNDCGIMVMLLMRFLRADSKPPVLPEEPKDRVNVMRWVGGRMRRRIAAELIAGQINPTDEMIPQWLSSA